MQSEINFTVKCVQPPVKPYEKDFTCSVIPKEESLVNLVAEDYESLEDAIRDFLWQSFMQESYIGKEYSSLTYLRGWYCPYMSEGEWAADLLHKAGLLIKHTHKGDPVPEEEVTRKMKLGIKEKYARHTHDTHWYLPLKDFEKKYGFSPKSISTNPCLP